MKIIDSHNHIAPDKVAKLTEDAFFKGTGTRLPAGNSFRVDGILSAVERCGIDKAVVFCVAERPAIEQKANDFVIDLHQTSDKLVALGSIHPDSENYGPEIERLKANGIKGIKAHSTFQNFRPDEERVQNIWRKLEEEQMILYLHTGEDVGQTGPGKASPERISRVMEAFPDLTIVAAHFGGLHMLEESKKHLLGKDVYFDMSWYPSTDQLDPGEIVDMMQTHGMDKILFGSDYPTTDAQKEIDWAMNLPLSDAERELVFYKNAQRLFDIAP